MYGNASYFLVVAQKYFGRMLGDRRKAKGLTQEDVAAILGISRSNYSLVETGKTKEVIDPERAIKLARLLEIDMLDLVIAMGYPIRLPGFEDEEEAAFLQAYRQLTRDQQRVLRAAVGLGSPQGR